MPALFIDDGYSCAATIAARPGFHPAAEVVYRPALARVLHTYRAAVKTGDPGKLDDFECDALAKHVVTLNGEAIDKAKAGKLHPLVRDDLIALVLSFTPGTIPPEADAPNS